MNAVWGEPRRRRAVKEESEAVLEGPAPVWFLIREFNPEEEGAMAYRAVEMLGFTCKSDGAYHREVSESCFGQRLLS